MLLIDDLDTPQALATYLKTQCKKAKLSREALAVKSGVPAPTIKRFETTGQISLKQLLKLWLCLDDVGRLRVDACQPTITRANTSMMNAT